MSLSVAAGITASGRLELDGLLDWGLLVAGVGREDVGPVEAVAAAIVENVVVSSVVGDSVVSAWTL